MAWHSHKTSHRFVRYKMDEEVNQIRQNTVAANSRAIYTCSYVRFLLWIVRNKERWFLAFFWRLDTSQTDSALRRDIDEYTDGNIENPPIYFARVTANDLMSWLLALKNADGGSLSYSSYNTHRAGLFNLFRLYNVAMPNTLERADNLI